MLWINQYIILSCLHSRVFYRIFFRNYIVCFLQTFYVWTNLACFCIAYSIINALCTGLLNDFCVCPQTHHDNNSTVPRVLFPFLNVIYVIYLYIYILLFTTYFIVWIDIIKFSTADAAQQQQHSVAGSSHGLAGGARAGVGVHRHQRCLPNAAPVRCGAAQRHVWVFNVFFLTIFIISLKNICIKYINH